jgi:hypothetical protein
VTLACSGDTSVTFVTFADASDARLEPAWALMTEENTCPSCSRPTRLATGAFASKKVVQLAAITFSVAEPLGAAAGEDVEEAELAGELDVELDVELDGELDVEVLLLPQAAKPAPSVHASRIPARDL